MLFRRRKKLSHKAEKFKLDDDAIDYIDNEYSDIDYDYCNFDSEEEIYESEKRKRKKKRKRKFLFRLSLLCIIVILVNIGIWYFSGYISINEPRKRDFPTRGMVVSDSLGNVKWTTLANQNISFAYVRATKGKSTIDKSFEDNWEKSQSVDLLVGAFHDFNFRQDGKEQAEHFSKALGDSMSGRLIPAVDISMSVFDKVFEKDPSKVVENLKDFIQYFKEKYDCKILIICDETSYENYIASDFADSLLWVKSTTNEIECCANWLIWEYSNKGNSPAYSNNNKNYPLLVAKQDMTVKNFKKKCLIK